MIKRLCQQSKKINLLNLFGPLAMKEMNIWSKINEENILYKGPLLLYVM